MNSSSQLESNSELAVSCSRTTRTISAATARIRLQSSEQRPNFRLITGNPGPQPLQARPRDRKRPAGRQADDLLERKSLGST